jgi:hypothetical protein
MVAISITLACLLAAGVFLSACADKAKLVDGKGPVGVYTLVSVNGAELPATISHDGAKLQVRSGTFIINENGTCSSKVVFVPPDAGEVTREVNATYTQTGARLFMTWEKAGLTIGTVKGDTFTMDNEGMLFSYRK